MSFFSVLSDIFCANILTIIFSVFTGYLVYSISKIYFKVLTFPPGPIPLPIVGNLLLLRTNNHWNEVFRQCAQKYGSVFTFWLGNNPMVFITDIEKGREAFRKSDFAGRQQSYVASHFANEKHQDVIFSDYGPTWNALRKVTHSAFQKYTTNDGLVNLVCDCVDKTVEVIKSNEGINKQFCASQYIFLLFLNILANSAFGERYSIEDEEFKKLKYGMFDFWKNEGTWAILWEFSPLIRKIDWKAVEKHCEITEDLVKMISQKLDTHYEDYDESIERDFCDALISAKNDALREGKESAPYLSDPNLVITILDLFMAGTDTSQHSFNWALLLLSYYPEVQKRLRQEIESQIGDRIPTHEDRNRCHYVMAFIAETLRFRNVVATGLPHKAIVSSKIGDHLIPKDSIVFVYQGMILLDEKYWTNAQEFRPERFLENGIYKSTQNKAYIPFGVGRRVCLGEKMAITDLFLVLVRLLQKTMDYDIILGKNHGIDPDPNFLHFIVPQQYNITFRPK